MFRFKNEIKRDINETELHKTEEKKHIQYHFDGAFIERVQSFYAHKMGDDDNKSKIQNDFSFLFLWTFLWIFLHRKNEQKSR